MSTLGPTEADWGSPMSSDSQPQFTNLDDLITKGEALFSAGAIEEAKRCFEAVLASNPGHSEALNNLAVL